MQVLLARVGKERLYSEAVDSHIGGWFRNAAVRTAPPDRAARVRLRAADRATRTFASPPPSPSSRSPSWPTGRRWRCRAPSRRFRTSWSTRSSRLLRGSRPSSSPVEDRPAQEGDTIVVDLVRDGQGERDYVVELGAAALDPRDRGGSARHGGGETKRDHATGDGEPSRPRSRSSRRRRCPSSTTSSRAPPASSTRSPSCARTSRAAPRAARGRRRDASSAQARSTRSSASRTSVSPELVRQRATDALAGALAVARAARASPRDLPCARRTRRAEQVEERIVAQAAGIDRAASSCSRRSPTISTSRSATTRSSSTLREQGEDEETIEQVVASGLRDQLRQDLRLRKALDRVVAEVKPISTELAQAREKLWTPEQEKGPGDTKLWTPSSKEPA